jgi:leucyl/phenylalanyl-tRNA--protein transferase
MADGIAGEIQWYSPDPRAILELDHLKISRSLRRTIKRGRFAVKWNTSFEVVMRRCADRQDTWISEEIIQAYLQMASAGFAHSVETWNEGRLVGGLYGISLGAAFFGESMFSTETDASKVALVDLVERLRACGFALLDIQFLTSHLKSLGAIEIPRTTYLTCLQSAVRLRRSIHQPFQHSR